MNRIKLVTIGLVKDAPETPYSITDPETAYKALDSIRHKDREHFVCLHLNARNQINAMDTISIGSLNATLVHPREVFKGAILSNAASVILAHNHPSNDTTPSREDIELTRRMVQAGDIMGIEILDHMIVTPGRFLSMKQANLF